MLILKHVTPAEQYLTPKPEVFEGYKFFHHPNQVFKKNNISLGKIFSKWNIKQIKAFQVEGIQPQKVVISIMTLKNYPMNE